MEAKKEIGKFVLIISADILEGGDIRISAFKGPIENKTLCYGILELAKDTVREHNPEKKKIIEPKTILSIVEGMKKS